jgi:hypothetical protein
MVLSAAVSSGVITAVQAWPDFFGVDPGDPDVFPGAGTDASGFTLERATPESFASDMAALVQSSRTVTVREPAGEPQDPGYVPDPEWT